MCTSTLPEKIDSPVAVGPPHYEVDVASAARDETWSDLYLDVFERLLMGGFFCWLVARLIADYVSEGNVGSLILLPSEGLVVVFMVIRRTSRAMSRHLGAWLLALGATCAPMLVAPVSDQAVVPVALGAVIILLGMIIQILAKLSLGRSMGVVAAHRGLSLVGPYRFVRHPMYAGYLLGHLAVLALNPTLWNLCVYSLAYTLQIPRFLLEERLLSVDPCYRDYQTQVRFRLIPGIF
jgi:protein-S-isoprenylcysteine O-methyltransferase Ste14